MIASDISIFELTDTDIPFVAVLEKNNFSTPWTKEELKKHLADYPHTFFVAKAKERVMGYIGFSPSYETADIITLCVEESFRRQGIAEFLLCFLLEKCKNLNIQKVFLEVRESNFPAIALYQKMGFYDISVRKNYYLNPVENARVLVKEIRQ